MNLVGGHRPIALDADFDDHLVGARRTHIGDSAAGAGLGRGRWYRRRACAGSAGLPDGDRAKPGFAEATGSATG